MKCAVNGSDSLHNNPVDGEKEGEGEGERESSKLWIGNPPSHGLFPEKT